VNNPNMTNYAYLRRLAVPMRGSSVVSMVDEFVAFSYLIILTNHIIVFGSLLCLPACNIPFNYSIFKNTLPYRILHLVDLPSTVVEGKDNPFDPNNPGVDCYCFMPD
jgi:hypothetical protein